MPLVSRIRRRTALAVPLTRFEQHILPCVGETRGIQCPLNRPFYRKCRGFRAYLEGNSDARGSFGALQDRALDAILAARRQPRRAVPMRHDAGIIGSAALGHLDSDRRAWAAVPAVDRRPGKAPAA